jgi:hypothetical protein
MQLQDDARAGEEVHSLAPAAEGQLHGGTCSCLLQRQSGPAACCKDIKLSYRGSRVVSSWCN